MRVLITGGAGFIGSNFVHYMLERYPHYEIVVLDKLTYAGRLENLQDVMHRIRFLKGDICNPEDVREAIQGCKAIFNFAAETHVDRSIVTPEPFLKTDVMGAYVLLEAAREHKIERFVQISTDEVYGSVEAGSSDEEDPLRPSSPYSASKAAADLLVLAYHRTYGLPVLITRSSNNFGPYQFPEKLIPLFIINALLDRPLPLYGDGLNTRDWLYVLDNCTAIDLVFREGKPGEIYNIASGVEKANIEITRLILKELDKPESLIRFVKDRPGHDRRYSLDTSKIRGLGWEPQHDFESSLRYTIEWYRSNSEWWSPYF
jgi:dTDP-glucose 4,6-dehydratase